MKITKFILSCFLLLFVIFTIIFTISIKNKIVAQDYESISEIKIQQKLQELKNSNLLDTILYSTIGYFRKEKVRFSKIVGNKLYVSEKGIFYQMNFADDYDNITVSCTFFQPHIRFIPLPPDKQDSTYISMMNEHLCRCKASFGYAVVEKKGKLFICKDTADVGSQIENYNINCNDLKDINTFAEKYYNIGYSIREKIKLLAKREILLLEE